MAGVPADPVALPAAEQAADDRRGQRMGAVLDPVGGLLAHHLEDVGRIHRDPAVADEIRFGAAVLRALEVRRVGAELAVAEGRGGEPQAVDVAGRHADRAAQADEHRVQVGALAAKVAGLEHRLDVAGAAASGLRLAMRVGDHPVVDRTRLVDVGAGALRGLRRGLANDAVERQQLGRHKIAAQHRSVLAGACRPAPVDAAAVAGVHAAGQRDARGRRAGGELRAQHAHAALRVGDDRGSRGVAGPRVVHRLLPVGGHVGQRQPYLDGALHVGNAHRGRHLEGAPGARARLEAACLLGAGGGGQRACDGCGTGGPEQRAAVGTVGHGGLLAWFAKVIRDSRERGTEEGGTERGRVTARRRSTGGPPGLSSRPRRSP